MCIVEILGNGAFHRGKITYFLINAKIIVSRSFACLSHI